VSGDQVLTASARLVGPVMVNLVGAIPRVQELLDRPVIVGGLAVMSRLNRAYRVTQDLDALRRRSAGAASGLEVLRAAGATELNEVGGLIATERGNVRVDVLEARDDDLDREFTDATDRLEAMAHQWTLKTATPMSLTATAVDAARPGLDGASPADEARAVALVAMPGPLIAMKLKASVDRPREKEATDLLDVVRLVTDPDTASSIMAEFEAAEAQLRDDVALHAELAFRTKILHTRQIIRGLGPTAVTADLIDAAADFLDDVLRSR
jgi:hypothetical protein